jgi:hypothetical protein
MSGTQLKANEANKREIGLCILVSVISGIAYQFWIMWSYLPHCARVANPTRGEIYPMNEHGTIICLSRFQEVFVGIGGWIVCLVTGLLCALGIAISSYIKASRSSGQ